MAPTKAVCPFSAPALPSMSAQPVPMAPSEITSGKNAALNSDARMDTRRISSVSSPNSCALRSSRTRVLVVLAPMMPSLNAPVMRLFCRRARRW